MPLMCQSCTKILHILLLMFRTISWGHHYYPYFWDEETDRNMVPKVTQRVSYKTRINSRSSDSNSHIISTTSRCTGCGLFFFCYLSLYVYCLKQWFSQSAPSPGHSYLWVLLQGQQKEKTRESEWARKVEPREWQGWGKLGSNLLMAWRFKSCIFMLLWRAVSKSLFQDCFVDHVMIIIFYQ